MLKRDIDFINKIKLDKEYQEKTKTWKDYTREEKADLIMRLQQYYDVHFTEATYYLQKQMFYFNFAEDNSAIVRVFPLEDYYKLDPNNKMEKYIF